MKPGLLIIAAMGSLASPGAAQTQALLRQSVAIGKPLAPGGVEEAAVRLRRGESADAVVRQQGVDIVVELLAPDGRLLATVDSPNGRQGDEPVSIVAERDGDYRLHARPISGDEPAGRISFELLALRSRAATRALAVARQREREAATQWLRERSVALPPAGILVDTTALAPFDRLAAEAQVVGLGEATHGSREFGDLRLSLVKRLVERHGYRLIALEDSASRWRALASYVSGEAADPGSNALEWGWIGRRSRNEMLLWARRYNLSHPSGRVRIVGVDPQDNGAYEPIGEFLGRAYGEPAKTAWAVSAAELRAADAQTPVFGNSGTSPQLRQASLELLARLENDAPLLRRRFGEGPVRQALETARDIAQFVDFNAGGGWISHSRDWYMASNLLAAMERSGEATKAVYWGHNAHVSAAGTGYKPAGALLREAMGCAYRGLATTFGEGGFIAQIPNDPADRLAVTTLPQASGETIETALAGIGPGAHLTVWNCGADAKPVPQWLSQPRPLRWVGGLYAPDSAASASYRPFPLTGAFDGIAYIPRVTAEDMPPDRPVIPARP